jgi:hypothetical protein
LGIRKRLHREAVIAGTEKPFRNRTLSPAQYLRCGKCGDQIPECRVTEHLLECQPGGAKCGKCKAIIPAAEFLAHFKTCGKNN